MDIDLDELEQMTKAITPLPWEVADKGYLYVTDANPNREIARILMRPKDYNANASYITAACNSLPTLIAENRALRERVRELEELCGNLNREVVNLMGSFPVTDCRICDYSYWCTREKTQIDPDFDMCKAAILEFCKPDSEETGE